MDKASNAALVADVIREAREVFPEYFTGASDAEVLETILGTIRRAGLEA